MKTPARDYQDRSIPGGVWEDVYRSLKTPEGARYSSCKKLALRRTPVINKSIQKKTK